MPDHVHMMISIPPKYAASEVVGFIKGKSGIHPPRTASPQLNPSAQCVRAVTPGRGMYTGGHTWDQCGLRFQNRLFVLNGIVIGKGIAVRRAGPTKTESKTKGET